MSVQSMTGYGLGRCRAEGVSAEVEISSVNRRQLDVQCVLPRSLLVLESRLQDLVRGELARGRVVLSVRVLSGRNGAVRVGVREELAASCLAALRSAARRLELPDDLALSALAGWPDVLCFSRPEDEPGRVWPAIRDAAVRALAGVRRMRSNEGRALARDLLRRAKELRAACRRMETLAPRAIRRHREALRERIRSAGLEIGGADDRLLKEIALFADRSDISEELTRIRSHLDQFEAGLGAGGAQGRALDFLAQELLREINTLNAKAADSRLLEAGLRFKTGADSLREQVQNIE